MLELEELQEGAVVREAGDIEVYGLGDVAFEGSLAFGEPCGDREDGARVLAGEGEDGIYECVGFDESAVEIDTEGKVGGWGRLEVSP